MMLNHLRPWALTISYAVIASLLLHLARFYPWHRLYLSQSKVSLFEHLPPAPGSHDGRCFLPRKAALSSTQANHSLPIGSVDKAGLDQKHCVHYTSRFTPYLAPAWGNTYIAKTRQRLGLQDSTQITNDLIWYANLLAENDPKMYSHIDWSNLIWHRYVQHLGPQPCRGPRHDRAIRGLELHLFSAFSKVSFGPKMPSFIFVLLSGNRAPPISLLMWMYTFSLKSRMQHRTCLCSACPGATDFFEVPFRLSSGPW